VTWHQLTTGPHAGKTLPEVFFIDADNVLDGIETGEFDAGALAEADRVRRLASRIRVPRREDDEQEVVVLYHLLPDGSFGGFVIVPKSDPRLAEYERFSTARSEGLDVTVSRRIAPGDWSATKEMVEALVFRLLGDPHRRLTAAECITFFDDPRNFLRDQDDLTGYVTRVLEGLRNHK
jgi:hypothetical protein